MKKILGIALVWLLTFGLTACGFSNNSGNPSANNPSKVEESIPSYKNIKPEEAKKLLESDNEIVLVDVRTLSEYADKHIPASTLIPLGQIEKEAPSKISNKDTQIIVYCRSGSRSVAAAKILVNMGYTNVHNLGGINSWPYDTESGK
ncbi:Rhodanese-related sulfurtransferase [Desulfitobacterium dichloroeliminans LMG P-21439]|uniref:Rhodanese-related sulfurtransferase n=1 Tax=Desulfitobacterium dichloroeliminans (strain LMG P-21439 / DCA1) TaxID=871963 RepID=L0F459_DESDL|nr:rhodanese-like domain-containing protein [Desulfitobacterium dichloroeliminans]AGA68609.1 Rhodanese-related sulfurtransferase [Desulfitobacterium dichloroeliminans LMG P-21439]